MELFLPNVLCIFFSDRNIHSSCLADAGESECSGKRDLEYYGTMEIAVFNI